MFCEKCGCRINERQTACPKCGHPAQYSEYCGGFWGLTGAAPAEPVSLPANPSPVTQKNGSKTALRVFQITTAVLAVCCCVLAFFVIRLSLDKSKTDPDPIATDWIETEAPTDIPSDTELTTDTEQPSEPESTVADDPVETVDGQSV